MDREQLERQFRLAKESGHPEDAEALVRALLASNSPETLEYHFSLLRDRENKPLYYRIRASFKDHGPDAEKYLLQRVKTERDPRLLADACVLLATMSSTEALPLARRMAESNDPELRYQGIAVIGWMGDEGDHAVVAAALLRDQDARVRSYAASALAQMHKRLPALQEKSLSFLLQAIETERDEDSLARIIFSVQEISRKKFGLKWDANEGVFVGNVAEAREKARIAFGRRGN